MYILRRHQSSLFATGNFLILHSYLSSTVCPFTLNFTAFKAPVSPPRDLVWSMLPITCSTDGSKETCQAICHLPSKCGSISLEKAQSKGPSPSSQSIPDNGNEQASILSSKMSSWSNIKSRQRRLEKTKRTTVPGDTKSQTQSFTPGIH